MIGLRFPPGSYCWTLSQMLAYRLLVDKDTVIET